MSRPRISVRAGTYHGRRGFFVTGRTGDGWPVGIFVDRRDTAEAIRDAHKEHAGDRERLSRVVNSLMMSERGVPTCGCAAARAAS